VLKNVSKTEGAVLYRRRRKKYEGKGEAVPMKELQR